MKLVLMTLNKMIVLIVEIHSCKYPRNTTNMTEQVKPVVIRFEVFAWIQHEM